MRNLHEKSLDQTPSNVDIIVFTIEIRANKFELEPFHNANELSSNIIRGF